MTERVETTEIIRRRYDRIAPFFDLFEGLMERMAFRTWRALQWSRVQGGTILEVGVGTGKNLPFYPAHSNITAVDFSQAMLERARIKARARNLTVDLRWMDVEQLDFPDARFDAVVGSFVFCSVPDPEKGLAEIHRVLKPGGQLVLLEHVLSERPWLARLMQMLNPLVVRLVGANINRRTVQNVAASGFAIERIGDLSGIVKLIEARRPN